MKISNSWSSPGKLNSIPLGMGKAAPRTEVKGDIFREHDSPPAPDAKQSWKIQAKR